MARNFDLINGESSLLKRKKLVSFLAKIDLPAPHFPSITVHGSRRLPMSLSANMAVHCDVITVRGKQFVVSTATEHCAWDVTNSYTYNKDRYKCTVGNMNIWTSKSALFRNSTQRRMVIY